MLHKHGKVSKASKPTASKKFTLPDSFVDRSTPSGGGKVIKQSNITPNAKAGGKNFVLGSTSKPAIFGITPEEIKKARVK